MCVAPASDGAHGVDVPPVVSGDGGAVDVVGVGDLAVFAAGCPAPPKPAVDGVVLVAYVCGHGSKLTHSVRCCLVVSSTGFCGLLVACLG